MPRKLHTGGVRRSLGEMAAILNMTEGEMMVLVKNRIPHTDFGNGRIVFTEHEVLAQVSPLPPRPKAEWEFRPINEVGSEEVEDPPTETVRPEPRPVPSMTSVKPPAPPAAAKKPAAKKKSTK